MKQTLFTTRQATEDLLKEVVSIWRQGAQKENLEGIEQDPTFKLLITTLAYQTNEIEDELEHFKNEVLEEFASKLTPYEYCRPIPASVIVKTSPHNQIPEITLNSSHLFTLADTPYKFMPLLKSRIVNCEVKSTTRLDGRRWKVVLHLKEMIKNLSGTTFMISSPGFQDLEISLDGQHIPLIKPWESANLPWTDCFSMDTFLYNPSNVQNVSNLWLDLFAQHDVRLFCIDNIPDLAPYETPQIELVFEFFGLESSFSFDKEQLVLNVVPLVNAEKLSATLSTATPVIRINNNDNGNPIQLLHLLPPQNDQLNFEQNVIIRRVAADRFNSGQLIKSVNRLINKFSSDYYAFQDITPLQDGTKIEQLYTLLNKIAEDINRFGAKEVPGVYLMLKNYPSKQKENKSITIEYLTTNGSAVNQVLSSRSMFITPPGLSAEQTQPLVPPSEGFDEVNDKKAGAAIAGYHLATNDRIVTPSDIKIFCHKELLTRYSIVPEMIKKIRISHRQNIEHPLSRYEIIVDITLIESPLIKRSFLEKIPQAELILQKKLEARSTGLYPINVSIKIE